MNSALVELVNTANCAFDFYVIGPPHNMKEKSVMERRVVRSIA